MRSLQGADLTSDIISDCDEGSEQLEKHNNGERKIRNMKIWKSLTFLFLPDK